MQKGQMLAESNVEFSVELVNGQRTLLVSCPRRRRPSPELFGIMLLLFDESDLCRSGMEAEVLASKSTTCSRRFDLFRVPLCEDLSPESAKIEGRKIVHDAFELYRLEAAAASEPVELLVRRPKPSRTHRVHAALRAA